MAALEKRVQVLFSTEQYARLEAEAAERRMTRHSTASPASVGSIR